jgi:hypothetical protein
MTTTTTTIKRIAAKATAKATSRTVQTTAPTDVGPLQAPLGPSETTERLTRLVRRLSSLEERKEVLEGRRDAVKGSIAAGLKAAGLDRVDTIYGNVVIRNDKKYNFSDNTNIQDAIRQLELAKTNLKALQDAAKVTMEPKESKTPVFIRNKAVSAIAKKSRIYVATVVRRLPPKPTQDEKP